MVPQLSIIIVNYRSAKLLSDCIRSVQQYNSGLVFEIIVVDNASNDGSRETITGSFPSVVWVQMNSNEGFARANNEGMKVARAETFLLLNPDTLSMDDSITRCYQQLNSSACIAAGVQQLHEDLSLQISGNYFMKGGLNHLLPIPYWGGFLRRLGYGLKMKMPHLPRAGSIEKVDWISGAFLMVKKEAVDKAGMMDEDFFLYAEEVEWCSRLGKHGSLCIFGDLKIIHLEGATVNALRGLEEKGYYNLYDKKGLQLMVSNHLRVRKQFGVGWFLFLLLNYTWGVLFYFICSTLHHLFTLRDPFEEWGKIAAFGRNVLRLWILAPMIISGRRYFYKMMR